MCAIVGVGLVFPSATHQCSLPGEVVVDRTDVQEVSGVLLAHHAWQVVPQGSKLHGFVWGRQ